LRLAGRDVNASREGTLLSANGVNSGLIAQTDTQPQGAVQMIRIRQTSPLALAAAVAVSLGLALGSATADAGERGASAPRQTAQHANKAPRGDYARHTEWQRTDNGYTRRDTWRGENGRTASRSDVTTRTDSGYTRDSTFTGPNGQTATRSANVVSDREAGTRTREAVTTLPDGRARSMTDSTARTADGYTRQTSITNPNGGTAQRDVQASYDPEAKTWSRAVSVDRNPPTDD
jgi:hypothetical protein